jgi:hypothetical protein
LRLISNSDYSVTHRLSSFSSYKLTHKDNGQVTLDGNFKVYGKDNYWLSLYTYAKLDQNETKRALPTKLHLRFHHENNKIIGLGVEEWDVINRSSPDVLSAYGLLGGDIQNGWRGFGGVQAAYKISNSNIIYHKYLLGIKNKITQGQFEFSSNRVTPKRGETKEEDKWSNNINLIVDHKYSDKLKLSKDLKFNLDDSKVDVQIGGEYKIDNGTFLKAKVANDQSLSLSLTHNYRGLINFGFAARVILIKFKYINFSLL